MPFVALVPAGALQTIRSAHRSSSSAASLAGGAPGLLAQARQSLRSAEGLQGDLAGDTARLLALKGDLASGPDLTPVINQVRMQSGCVTCPGCVWLSRGPAELRIPSCSPAALLRHGRTHSSVQTHSAGELAEHPCLGITDPTALPSTPPSLTSSLQGLSHITSRISETPFNFWLRFLLFLPHGSVIAMETHFGGGCCGDHQPPLSAAGGTSTF